MSSGLCYNFMICIVLDQQDYLLCLWALPQQMHEKRKISETRFVCYYLKHLCFAITKLDFDWLASQIITQKKTYACYGTCLVHLILN